MRPVVTAAFGTLAFTGTVYFVWFYLSYFEVRTSNPPFWRGQFKTFFPGDVFLGAAIGLAYAVAKNHTLHGPSWLPASGIILGFMVGALLFFFQFSPEEKADPNAIWIWAAPTRVWHQFFVWWVGIALVMWLVVPVVTTLVSGDLRTTSAVLVPVFMVVYAGHLAYDGLRPPEKVPGKPVHAPLRPELRSDRLEEILSKVYPH